MRNIMLWSLLALPCASEWKFRDLMEKPDLTRELCATCAKSANCATEAQNARDVRDVREKRATRPHRPLRRIRRRSGDSNLHASSTSPQGSAVLAIHGSGSFYLLLARHPGEQQHRHPWLSPRPSVGSAAALGRPSMASLGSLRSLVAASSRRARRPCLV